MTREKYLEIAQQIADLEIKIKDKSIYSKESQEVEAQILNLCTEYQLTMEDLCIIDDLVQNILS